jgi:hypothetical protein
MTYRNFFFLILLAICISSYTDPEPKDEAKDMDKRRWKSGFVVTTKGDTVRGQIKTIDFLDVYYDYQRTVSFKTAKGNITNYLPSDLVCFAYADDNSGDLVTLQSVSSPEGDGPVLLRLYCNGLCRVYGLTTTEVKGSNLGPGQGTGQIHSALLPTEKKYLQIGGSEFFLMKRIGFKKNMKDIFASCPRILSGLDNKQYTYDNWQVLVWDYNHGMK